MAENTNWLDDMIEGKKPTNQIKQPQKTIPEPENQQPGNMFAPQKQESMPLQQKESLPDMDSEINKMVDDKPVIQNQPLTNKIWTAKEYFTGLNSPGRARIPRTQILKMTSQEREAWAKNQDIYDALRFQNKPDTEVMAKIKAIDPNIQFSQTGDGKFMHIGNQTIRVFKKNDDGYPELTLPLSGVPLANDQTINWRYYSTPKGKLNAVKKLVGHQFAIRGKKVNPDDYVELGRDSTMNPIVVVKKPFPRFRDEMYKPGKYYFNKSGISAGDIDSVKPFIEDAKFALAGSAGTAGMRWFWAIPTMGGIAGGGEYFNQLARQENDLSRLLFVSLGAAGGEGAGRAISWTVSKGMQKYFSHKLDKLARKISGDPKMKATDKTGNFSDEFLASLKKKGISPDELADAYKIGLSKEEISKLNAEQRQAYEDFKAIGAQGTRGQILRDYPSMAREAELVKDVAEGAPLRARHGAQQQSIVKEIDRLINRSRGTINPEEAGMHIRGGLGQEETQRRALGSSIYKRAKVATGNESLIAKQKFDDVMTQIQSDYIKQLPPSVDALINKFKSGDIPLTLRNVENQLIKLVNKQRSLHIPKTAEYSALSEVKHAANKLIEQMGMRQGRAGALYRAGRAEVSSRKSEFNAKDIIDKLLHSRGPGIADEKVHQKLLASSHAEIRKALRILSRNTAGKQAIKDWRATVLNEMKDTVIRYGGQGAGTFRVTEANWNKIIEKYGKAKLKTLFTDRQWQDIMLIKRVTSYQDFQRGVYNFSGTFSAFKNWIDRVNGTIVGRFLAPVTKPMGEAAEIMARRKFVDKSMLKGFKPNGVNTFLLRLRGKDGTIKEIPIVLPSKSRAISGAIGAETGAQLND